MGFLYYCLPPDHRQALQFQTQIGLKQETITQGKKKNDNKKIKIKIYKSKHLFGEHILSWGLPQKIVTPEDHDQSSILVYLFTFGDICFLQGKCPNVLPTNKTVYNDCIEEVISKKK